MDKEEARALLERELARYRSRPYGQLVGMIGDPVGTTVATPSGTEYNLEIESCWDDKARGDVRVIAMLDDGGRRSFMSPLCADFIMRPDGSFVGE
jgi:hypothetical protein